MKHTIWNKGTKRTIIHGLGTKELQKARQSERERILALAEDVEIFTAFGYDTTTVKMIDPAKIINNKTNGF